MCGTPNEDEWPELTKLKYYKELAPKSQIESQIKEYFRENNLVDDITLSILEGMLKLTPSMRLTA